MLLAAPIGGHTHGKEQRKAHTDTQARSEGPLLLKACKLLMRLFEHGNVGVGIFP